MKYYVNRTNDNEVMVSFDELLDIIQDGKHSGCCTRVVLPHSSKKYYQILFLILNFSFFSCFSHFFEMSASVNSGELIPIFSLLLFF